MKYPASIRDPASIRRVLLGVYLVEGANDPAFIRDPASIGDPASIRENTVCVYVRP